MRTPVLNTSFVNQNPNSYMEDRINDQRWKDGFFDITNPGGNSGNRYGFDDEPDYGGNGGSVESGDSNEGGIAPDKKESELDEISAYYEELRKKYQAEENNAQASNLLLYAAIGIGIYSILK